MTAPNPFPEPEPGLDAVVRALLDAEADRNDARGMADRVLARLAADAAPAAPARPSRSWRRVAAAAGAAAVAIGILVAAFVLSGPREAVASPTQVVQSARDAVTPNEARCYRVTMQLPARARESFPLLALDSEATRTLCTRGNRFVVEPGFGGRGAWGRDDAGRVWAAPTREAAVAFAESELPPHLRTAVKIHELDLATLLEEVLADFDLTWSEPPARGAGTYAVAATRRGETPPLHIASAELVVERAAHTIRTLTVRRRAPADGSATLAFTLLGTAQRDDAAFTAQGHLNPGAPVYDRAQPVLRRRVVVQQLREMASGL
jgi:hypothetical protein